MIRPLTTWRRDLPASSLFSLPAVNRLWAQYPFFLLYCAIVDETPHTDPILIPRQSRKKNVLNLLLPSSSYFSVHLLEFFYTKLLLSEILNDQATKIRGNFSTWTVSANSWHLLALEYMIMKFFKEFFPSCWSSLTKAKSNKESVKRRRWPNLLDASRVTVTWLDTNSSCEHSFRCGWGDS